MNNQRLLFLLVVLAVVLQVCTLFLVARGQVSVDANSSDAFEGGSRKGIYKGIQ